MSTLDSSGIYRALSTVTTRLSAFVRGSLLYRWLTAEPDPEVIVIDLRETWTVGPFLSILDYLAGAFEHSAVGSTLIGVGSAAFDRTRKAPVRMAGFIALGLAALAVPSAVVFDRTAALFVGVGLLAAGTIALFDRRSWQELRRTRPVELLVAAFEPPDPPSVEGDSESHHGEATDDREAAQDDTDEPEGDALDESHQRVDREVADEGAGGEGDERDGRRDTGQAATSDDDEDRRPEARGDR